MNEKSLDRRSFLKGALATGAVAAGGMALAACSPQTASTSGSTDSRGTNLNVMKVDRSGPIKGLYAAGNTLGQRYGVGYSTPSAGNSMGMAMTHGRCAGKIMAKL